jgi:hypothetical protein
MARTVDCPNCGRKVEFTPASRWRPFCSERCRTSDLGAWASGRYVIAGAPREETSSDGDGDPGRAPPARRYDD